MGRRIIEVDFGAGKPYWDANKKLWEALSNPGSDHYNSAMKYNDEIGSIKASLSAKHKRTRKHPHLDACIQLMRRARRAGSTFKEWIETATHEDGEETLHIFRRQNRYIIELNDNQLSDGKTFSETTLRGWWTAAGKK